MIIKEQWEKRIEGLQKLAEKSEEGKIPIVKDIEVSEDRNEITFYGKFFDSYHLDTIGGKMKFVRSEVPEGLRDNPSMIEAFEGKISVMKFGKRKTKCTCSCGNEHEVEKEDWHRYKEFEKFLLRIGIGDAW